MRMLTFWISLKTFTHSKSWSLQTYLYKYPFCIVFVLLFSTRDFAMRMSMNVVSPAREMLVYDLAKVVLEYLRDSFTRVFDAIVVLRASQNS
ncbi:hypothetical protein DL96DRAFT_1576695 [Flagelloscypha sp. PMI_526]|nr:hypothetical protein DL96DRAFT_1576695 [Flagelloscypha sp. PMI_526]